MNTIHLVSHTHWDREWYLPFQQFHLQLVQAIDQLLEIFEKEPDYRYFLLDGQAIILEDYLMLRPERGADLRRYIADGRLLTGPWYISPDEFLVSAESHIRNLLEGDRICRKFGPKLAIGYLPDTFGHIAQMPQILQGFGINDACLFRGLDDQPVELIWKAPDGSSVLLSYLRDSYSNAASLTPSDPGRFKLQVDEISQSLAPFSQTGQILLMHGTDHMEPTRNLPAAIQAYCDHSPQNDLNHSTLLNYFEAVRSRISANSLSLPVVNGELRSSKRSPILPNVLSTRIRIKQRNHECEQNLVKWVEPYNAWISLLNSHVPNRSNSIDSNYQPRITDQASLIRSAWKLLMQCHPHDSICGTTIDQVVIEMQVRFDQVDQISQELSKRNLQTISQLIDTTFPDSINTSNHEYEFVSSLLVFNPNDQPQSGMIELNINLEPRFRSFSIINEDKAIIPHHQKGLGLRELISTSMDKKGMRQALTMIHDGNVAGLIIRDFNISTQGNKVEIQATLTDHGRFDRNKWNQAILRLDEIFADPAIDEFIIHAYSDPEVDLSFIANDIPGHGCRRYWIRAGVNGGTKAAESVRINSVINRLLPVITWISKTPLMSQLVNLRIPNLSVRSPKIENEFFLVEVASPDGTLTVTDKRTGQIYFGLNRFVDGGDCGDVYNYAPPSQDRIISSRNIKVKREVNEICQKLVIRGKLSFPHSLSDDRKARTRKVITHEITSLITLEAGIPRIDIHTEFDNHALDHRLRVHFPAPFSCSSAYFDGHFELVERPIGLAPFDESWVEPPRPEVPEQQFAIIKNERVSLTIANRGLPEVEVFQVENGGVEIAITLLRCVGWLSRDDFSTRKGHAGPMGIATPQAQMIGHHSFDYSVIPGDNNINASIHQSYAFNSPLKVVNTSLHQGDLKPSDAFITNNNPNFILTAIKLSEDGSRLIVRGFNLLPIPIEVVIKPFRSFNHSQLVNLAEDNLQPIPITDGRTIKLIVGAKKIVSISLYD